MGVGSTAPAELTSGILSGIRSRISHLGLRSREGNPQMDKKCQAHDLPCDDGGECLLCRHAEGIAEELRKQTGREFRPIVPMLGDER